jgi:ATP-dependent DNA helicase 2 subunit 2
MTLVGVDFNESTDDQNRLTSMASWYSLFSGLPNSKVWHGGDVLGYLANPNPKLVRPVKVFQGEFRIGADLVDPEFDADIDQSCLCIPVEGYPGVKGAKPPTRKNFGLNEQGEPVSISNLTEYHVRNYTKPEDNMDEVDNNDDIELAQRQFEIQLIDKSGLIKAYKYGSSTVVLPEELESQRVYQTIPGLDIIKVIPENHLPRWYLQSETVLIMGQSNSVKEIRAFAAVVDSLKDLNAIAIGRYVQKKNAEVQIVALLPVYIHKLGERKRRADDTDRGDMRALALSRIPFMEDEKMASFPDLTNLTTTSGRVITGNHKLLPDEQVKETMDEFVESMDLDQLGIVEADFDGDKRVFNQMTPDFSMKHHDVLVKRSVGNRRIDHMLKQIAINAITEGGLKKYCSKDDIIPLFPESLKADMEPDAKLVSKGEPILEKLASLLKVTKVDKTKFTRRRKQLDEIMLQEDEDNISLEELLSRGVRS